MENRRDPLSKEKFLEGNRQKWMLILLGVGLLVLGANIALPSLDIAPYMQYFLAISAIFLFGASADSALKVYQVSSLRNTQIKEETKRDIVLNNGEPTKRVALKFQEEYGDDPSYAPPSWINKQETEDFR